MSFQCILLGIPSRWCPICYKTMSIWCTFKMWWGGGFCLPGNVICIGACLVVTCIACWIAKEIDIITWIIVLPAFSASVFQLALMSVCVSIYIQHVLSSTYLYSGVESHNCPYFNAEIDVTEKTTMLDIMLNVRMLAVYCIVIFFEREKTKCEWKKRRKKEMLQQSRDLFFLIIKSTISKTTAGLKIKQYSGHMEQVEPWMLLHLSSNTVLYLNASNQINQWWRRSFLRSSRQGVRYIYSMVVS